MRKALLGVALALWLASPAQASRLVYSSTWSGSSQIYALDPAAKKPAQLTFGVPGFCRERPASCGFVLPTPSPDGRHVAFFGSQFCKAGLYVARADGANRRLVASSERCALPRAVAWSADSRRLVYSLGDSTYVAKADGSGSRLFAVGSSPAWSRDGSSLAYLTPSVPDRPGALAVRTGKRLRILATDVAGFAWSPTGKWIVVDRRLGDPYARVELVRPTGGARRILADTYAHGLAWSRDGRFVAFGGKDGLQVIEVATGAGRTLGGYYGSDHPWSPTGHRLAFDGEQGVAVHDPVANTTTLVSPEHTRNLVWSPDGRSLAYSARTFTTGYNFGGDLVVATTSGAVRTVVAAAGDYGGEMTGLAWTKSQKKLRYRAAAARVIAQTSPNQLVAPWAIDRIAADGGTVAYVSCGHVFVWTPSTSQVKQAEGIASLVPRCTTPGDYVAFWIYGLALDGDRIAYAHIEGNMGQTWSLDGGSFASTPRMSQLAIKHGAAGCTEGENGLGSVVGGGGVLVYSTWHDRSAPGCSGDIIEQRIHRVDSDACPCPVISSSPGPLVPFDTDGGRIIAGGMNDTLLLDGDGHQLRSIPVSPLAAQLSGSDIVILVPGALRHFDAETGAAVHTWPLPDVPSGGECGRPHGRGWECRQARLVLQDVAHGLAAYVVDGQVHLLRLADGTDAVVSAGSRARFIDSGLVYADGARLRHVPFAELPVRGF
jgi:Tol biopolymer transport system component